VLIKHTLNLRKLFQQTINYNEQKKNYCYPCFFKVESNRIAVKTKKKKKTNKRRKTLTHNETNELILKNWEKIASLNQPKK